MELKRATAGIPSEFSSTEQTAVARAVAERAYAHWGPTRRTVIIGQDPAMTDALDRMARLAAADCPVLISGETGTGKELFARALYLLSPRVGTEFVAVNCAQYQEGQIIASELFGHRRGSFTGALSDHRGVFEAADGGVLFLDEVGELSAHAQALLLRVLSEGEIVPVGETRARRLDVRVVAASNRPLRDLVAAGRFRTDLYYRLRGLQLSVPPVRQRGRDWELILQHYLRALGHAKARRKHFSPEALTVLSAYEWPGNVRELRAVVDTSFYLSDGDVIEPRHFVDMLEPRPKAAPANDASDKSRRLLDSLCRGDGSFWDLVHGPYLDREISRADVRELVALGLGRTRGSYKKLTSCFGIGEEGYLKFMDFLRHHRLKPN